MAALECGIVLTDTAKDSHNIDNDEDIFSFDSKLAALASRAHDIRVMAQKKNLISVKNNLVLEKLESGRLSFTKQDKNSLKNLLVRLEIEI